MAKKKRKGLLKGFFGEFKTFITRGNVLDMAVGVIVGGAFTAIVNAMSNNILRPLINWLLAVLIGEDGLSGAITMLSPAYDEAGALILADSIYIDWGAFVSAVINFLLIAFVLFMIVRVMNRIAKAHEEVLGGMELGKKKAVAKIRKERKISYKEALAVYEEELAAAKAKKAEEERIAAEKAAEEKAIAEEKAMANTRLLEEIRDLLKSK